MPIAVNSEEVWQLDRTDERYLKLLGGIVAFKISIEKVDATFKLNQNKTEGDQQGVINARQKSGCLHDHEVADMMGGNNDKFSN